MTLRTCDYICTYVCAFVTYYVRMYFRHESRLIRYGGVIRSLTSAFTFSAILQLLLGLSVIVFVATGGELTARRVFTSLALLSHVRRISGAFLIRGIFLLYEAHVATTRIQVSQDLIGCMQKFFQRGDTDKRGGGGGKRTTQGNENAPPPLNTALTVLLLHLDNPTPRSTSHDRHTPPDPPHMTVTHTQVHLT